MEPYVCNILVVDDDPFQRKLLCAFFAGVEHRVTLVSSAEQARALLEHPNLQRFDLVLTDLHMPGVSGLELTRIIRANPLLRDLPVLLLTGESSLELLVECFDAGADDYIKKPIVMMELHARVRAALRIRRMSLGLRRLNETMARELQEAQRLQEAMLPERTIEFDAMRVDWRYVPSMYVAGDFFDCFTLPDGRIVVYIADSVGHGAASAMFAFFIRQLLRSDNNLTLDDPAMLCEQLDTLLVAQNLERYLTLFYAVYDPVTRDMEYCAAGHPSPYYWSDGEVGLAPWDCGGAPVGMGLGLGYENGRVSMKPGDRMLLYSDGLSEAQNRVHVEFPCAQRISMLVEADTTVLLDTLLQEAVAWVGQDTFEDDVTLVGVLFH